MSARIGSFTGLAVPVAVALAVSCGGPSAPKPADNIVLITLDTVRADRLGVYGGPVETPSLTALAARGVRFRNATSPAPLTAPSHASILSGSYPWRHGLRLNGRAFPENQSSLAVELGRDRATAAFIGGRPLARPYGFDRGFDTFDDYFGQLPRGKPRVQRTADEVIDRAIAWLGGRPDGRFFLWVHLFDAHSPYRPPEPHLGRYPDDPYAGELAFVDAELGRLLSALSAEGLTESTLVVVAGDHGEALGDHGEDEHGLLIYEEVLRVPLILAGPGFDGGTTVDVPVSLVDLRPTVLEAVGLELPPRDTDGVSLLSSTLDDKRALLAETIYPEVEFGWAPLCSVRVGQRKAIEAPQPELYDLANDPRELDNLAEGFPDELQEMLARCSLRPITGGAQRSELSADDVAAFESLGYISDSSPASTSGERASPKDRMPDYRLYQEGLHLGFTGARPADGAAALAIFQELLEREPRNPQYRYRRAALLARLDRHAEADRAYRGVIADHPTWMTPVRSFAEYLTATARGGEAVALLEAFLAAQPSTVALGETLAMAHRSAGDTDAALAVARRLREANPASLTPLLLIGHLAGEAGLVDESRQAFESALVADPGNSRATFSLSRVLETLGTPTEALPHLKASLEVHPNNLGVAQETCRLAQAHTELTEAAALCQAAQLRLRDSGH